jgi:multiple sugar transport system substrate-binding protein
MIKLRGISWNHTRGILPMQATAQRFSELHPDVEIHWEKRSLQQFEEFPIEKLAATYDLLVIDHPFIGYAARHQIFLPLDDWLSPEVIADQERNSVGGSHASYVWEDHLWALAIDAAAPVAAWRPDLLATRGVAVPATWPEVLALAATGAVETPAAPINCLMNFYGLCLAAGEAPFSHPTNVVGRHAGEWAFARLSELITSCPPDCVTRNPIQSLELLASSANTTLAYCLFPYGYSNYARDGYADHALVFGDVPALEPGRPLPTTLGGTGLAISARSTHPQLASDYAAFVASERIQRTLYAHAGGQPGHRAAWLDAENNRRTHDYFRATLPALDRAFVRPRYANYLHAFQEKAGLVVNRCVRGELAPPSALAELDALYVRSLSHS